MPSTCAYRQKSDSRPPASPSVARENFLYVFKGARSAPGHAAADLGRHARTRRLSAASAADPGHLKAGTAARTAPAAFLRPCRATSAPARTLSPHPVDLAGAATSAVARELQEVAIHPAPAS